MIENGKQNNALKERMNRYKNLENKIFHNQGQSSAQPYTFLSVILDIILQKFNLNLIFDHIVIFLSSDFF